MILFYLLTAWSTWICLTRKWNPLRYRLHLKTLTFHEPVFPLQKGTFLTLPSLAFLKISVGGDNHLPDVNLARLLVGCVGLRHVHLVLESNTIKLRHTLQHKLHPRLDQVTLEGSKIVRLHPAAFKVNKLINGCSTSMY